MATYQIPTRKDWDFWTVCMKIACSTKTLNLTILWIFLWSILRSFKDLQETIHPGLRLVPSGNFFLVLNWSKNILLKKSEFNKQLEHNDSNLITLLYILLFFSNVKWSKLNNFAEVALSNSDFFNKKDDFYLKPKRNFRMAQAWDQAELFPCCQAEIR